MAVSFGNLTWQDVPVRKDLEVLLPSTKVLLA